MNLLDSIKGKKLPALAVIALVFAAVSIISRKPTEIRVPMVTPPSSTFTESISGIGIVEPASELIAVGTEIPGIVRRVYVKVGDQVTTGTPLFQLDQREIDAQIGSLKAALSSAQLQAEEAKSQFATLEALHDRRAVSKDEFVRREYAAKVGKAKVAEIQAQLREALTTKARLTVGSPMNGEILEVNIRPGEFASTAGTSEPLIRMGDTRELHIRVEVDEQYSGRVSASSAAYGSPRGNTSLRIPLKFVRFERFVKPKVNLATGGQRVDTRVLEVVYSLTPTENPIFVGQQMDVFIDATRAN